MTASWLALSCTDDIPSGLPVVLQVEVRPDSADVAIGATLEAQAVPFDADGTLVTGRGTEWRSDATDVATVDGEGVVTGVGSGTATVTATVDGREGSARVRVDAARTIGVSTSALAFERSAGEDDPPPVDVVVENTGGFELEGLTVSEVAYGPGGEGWLVATLDGDAAPALLSVSVQSGGQTDADSYEASIHLDAADVVNGPVMIQVTFEITPGPAASVDATGDGQTGTAGSPVPTAPSVALTDAFGNPVPGIAVEFAVTAGGGTVIGASQITDESGRATVGEWILGTAEGENMLVATPDVPGIGPVEFTATGLSKGLEIVDGDGQTVTVATAVPVSPAVRVRDGFGDPLPGETVVFTVTAGDGTLTGSSAVSDSQGIARVGSWVLGTAAGENLVEASVSGGPTTVFSATGEPDAPASMSVSGDGLTARVGTAPSVLPTFTIEDQHGNPVPGVDVAYASTGGGSVTGPSTTDSGGQVTLTGWTLGGEASDDEQGRMVNTVTVTDASSGSVTATATAYGIYEWTEDVQPLMGAPCAGCHGSPSPYATWSNIVNSPAFASCSGRTRVVPGDADASVIYRVLQPAPPCAFQMVDFDAEQLKKVRAWINSGAPEN